jgi:uncharacterized protein YehS (DUF1456 family)
MTTNEILQSCFRILNISESEMVEIFKLGNFDVNPNTLSGYLKPVDDKEFLDCGYEALGSFLDGLIVYKRGPSDNKSSSDEDIRLNNNLILKKLRIAYELKEVDLYAIFSAVDIDITKGELNALFRKEGHKNYRACPDSILQLFLEGLEICELELGA